MQMILFELQKPRNCRWKSYRNGRRAWKWKGLSEQWKDKGQVTRGQDEDSGQFPFSVCDSILCVKCQRCVQN